MNYLAGPMERDLMANYADVRKRLYSVPPKPVSFIPPKPKPRPSHRRRSTPIYFEGNTDAGRQEGQLRRPLTIARRVRLIIAAVSYKHNIPIADMKSRCRWKHVTAARFEAIARIRKKTPISTTQIGRHFGNRDHSTIVHAIHMFEQFPERYEPGTGSPRWTAGFEADE